MSLKNYYVCMQHNIEFCNAVKEIMEKFIETRGLSWISTRGSFDGRIVFSRISNAFIIPKNIACTLEQEYWVRLIKLVKNQNACSVDFIWRKPNWLEWNGNVFFNITTSTKCFNLSNGRQVTKSKDIDWELFTSSLVLILKREQPILISSGCMPFSGSD